jgi:hypothetical protein
MSSIEQQEHLEKKRKALRKKDNIMAELRQNEKWLNRKTYYGKINKEFQGKMEQVQTLTALQYIDELKKHIKYEVQQNSIEDNRK